MATGVRAITRGRMSQWAKNLTRKHHTPVLVMGIGHDHIQGQISVITVEDVDDQELALMLRHALGEVQNRLNHEGHEHDH